MPLKKITIFSILSLILFGLILVGYNFSKNKKIEDIKLERGKIIFSKEFKNGINLLKQKEAYKKIFKEAQRLVDLPIKYPTELPENYKLFRVVLWQEKEGVEGIEIYYDVNYDDLSEKNIIVEKGTKDDLGTYVLNKDKKTILLKETNMKPSFLNTPNPQEIGLLNKKMAFLWNFSKSDDPSEISYEKSFYLGYSNKNNKKYFYTINTNTEDSNVIEIANSIIKNDKNNE